MGLLLCKSSYLCYICILSVINEPWKLRQQLIHIYKITLVFFLNYVDLLWLPTDRYQFKVIFTNGTFFQIEILLIEGKNVHLHLIYCLPLLTLMGQTCFKCFPAGKLFFLSTVFLFSTVIGTLYFIRKCLFVELRLSSALASDD